MGKGGKEGEREGRGETAMKIKQNQNIFPWHVLLMAAVPIVFLQEKSIKKRQSRYDFAVLYLRFRKDYSAGFSSALGASAAGAAGASALGAAAGAAGFASAAGAAGLLPVITPFGHLFAQMPQDLHLL